MPSEKKKLTLNGLIDTILQPNTNIKDSQSRQQAYLVTLASLILAGICFIAGIVGLIIGFPASLIVGLFFLTISMSAACALGRTENFLVGSILLVSGIILGGFFNKLGFSGKYFGHYHLDVHNRSGLQSQHRLITAPFNHYHCGRCFNYHWRAAPDGYHFSQHGINDLHRVGHHSRYLHPCGVVPGHF